MPKRLREIERDVRREKRRAERWVGTHGGGSLPGKRSDTGESATAVRMRLSPEYTDGARFPQDEKVGELPRPHRHPISYDAFGGAGAFEDWLLDEGMPYRPLVAQSMPGVGQAELHVDLEKKARVHHVLSFMDEGRVNLLFMRHVERMTLDAIAAEKGVTRQAIIKQLKTADRHFKASLAEHWNDDLLVEDISFMTDQPLP